MHVTLTCMYIVTLLCTVVTCIMHDVCALHHAMLLTLLWCDTCMLPSVLDIDHIQVLTSSSTLTCCLPPFCSTPLPSSHDTGEKGGKYICTLILFSHMHVHCDIVMYCCYTLTLVMFTLFTCAHTHTLSLSTHRQFKMEKS